MKSRLKMLCSNTIIFNLDELAIDRMVFGLYTLTIFDGMDLPSNLNVIEIR